MESLNEQQAPTKKKEIKTPPKPIESEGGNKPMEGAKVVVKQSGEKGDKKKSFNYESVIEITLPQQQQNLSHTVDQVKDKSSGYEEKLEEPIKPIICTPKQSKLNNNEDKKFSPCSGANDNESFVSNKQNPLMEWDSFIPVSHAHTYSKLLLCIQNALNK